MITVKLFCAAGMSTSLLVAKMNEVAAKENLDVKVKAYPIDKIAAEIATSDIVLLGPQVGYLLAEAKGYAAPLGIPVGIIPMKDYGRVNGKGVLDYVMLLLNT
jgi:PTS system cellobiose-specific IIB component